MFETALAIRDAGITLMIVEQNTKRALAISDRAVVLELGRMILEGPARDVVSDQRVRAAYLGEAATQVSTE